MQYEVIGINTIKTAKDGQLSFFESNRDIPFEIKRIYYITDVNMNGTRGAHAHKKLHQLLFCPYGSITIQLSNGKVKEEIVLDTPDKGLIIHPGLWRDMLWNKEKSVLCVAASLYYDENDYIRDYEEYMKYISGCVNT